MRLGKLRYDSKFIAIKFFYETKNWSINWMCKQLEISRAAYYKWLHREIPKKEAENMKLAEFIKEYDERFNHILGYRRMTSWINHFNHTDSPFDGKPAFLQAAANWYRNVHGVELDWRSQLFAVEGAVDGLAGLFAILIDRGDAVAFADPYYPSYHACPSCTGRRRYCCPPARTRLATRPGRGGRIGVAPAAHADTQLSEQPHGRARRRRILRARGGARQAVRLPHVHDFAYTGLGVSDQQVSLLTVPGASDVSVEVGSLSKMYAMAGWRAGFVAGNRDVVARLKQYHYQMGSMVTGMIQDAGAVALNSDQSCVDELARRYAGRREIVAGGLRSLGFDVFDSAGGIYVWLRRLRGWSGATFRRRVA